MLKLELIEQSDFFERYYQQLSNIRCMGLDYKVIWSLFCEGIRIPTRKQWLISKKDLEKLDRLSDEQLYRAIGIAVSKFFKGSYKGEGI